jgi:hypothetical protein
MSLVVTTTIPPEKWSEIFKDEFVLGAVAIASICWSPGPFDCAVCLPAIYLAIPSFIGVSALIEWHRGLRVHP